MTAATEVIIEADDVDSFDHDSMGKRRLQVRCLKRCPFPSPTRTPPPATQ